MGAASVPTFSWITACAVSGMVRGSPVYRWPGGNFVSGYNWRDGIGDPDKRPPRKNPAWKGIEHNDVGIHEYMALMREIELIASAVGRTLAH